MSDKVIENNQVTIMGEVVSEFTFSHEVFGEGFYMVEVLVRRLSNSDDRIPLMVSERLIDVTQDYRGEYIMVTGQFRSYNRHEEDRNRLVLSVFAREISFVEEELDGAKCWTDISVRRRFIEKHRSEEKLRIYCWQSIDHTENQITYRVSVGEEMRDMRHLLKWENTFRFSDVFRVENM